MAINPFVPPPPSLTAQQTVSLIVGWVGQSAQTRLDRYRDVQRVIWNNPAGLSPDEIIKALETDGRLTIDMLQEFAILDKTVMNIITPGTVMDTVPEASITMPGA